MTPIDREDIATLTKALDDVVDGIEHCAAFAVLYSFQTLSDPMRQMVDKTCQSAKELVKAVRQLRLFGNPESIRESGKLINQLESEADVIYRKAISKLFDDGLSANDLVRNKDLLNSLEEGVDVCEDAMDVIRSVVVKNG